MLLRGGALVVAVAVVAARPAAPQPSKVHVGLSASFAARGRRRAVGDRPADSRLCRVDPAAGRVKCAARRPELPVRARLRRRQRLGRLALRRPRHARQPGDQARRQTRISVGSAPYALTFGAGAVWVSNEGSGTVSRIAPSRNRVTKTIRVGGSPNGIARRLRQGLGRRLRPQPADPDRPAAQPRRPAHRAAAGRLDHGFGPTRSGSRARAARSTRSTRPRWRSWRP